MTIIHEKKREAIKNIVQQKTSVIVILDFLTDRAALGVVRGVVLVVVDVRGVDLVVVGVVVVALVVVGVVVVALVVVGVVVVALVVAGVVRVVEVVEVEVAI
jgi:hypothetical protein